MHCGDLEPRIELLLEEHKLGTIFIYAYVCPTDVMWSIECRAGSRVERGDCWYLGQIRL